MKQFTILFFTVFLITISIGYYQDIFAEETTIIADPIEQANENLEAVAVNKPNWQTMEGQGVSLSLPEGYQGGNPIVDLQSIEEKLANLDASQRLKPIQNNLEQIALIAFDTTNFSDNNWLTNVHVLNHSWQESMTLENYLSQAVAELESTHQIEQQNMMNQGQSSIGRILTTVTTSEQVKIKQLFYFQPQQDKIWITTYTTPASEFQQRSANFEQSIATLEISSS